MYIPSDTLIVFKFRQSHRYPESMTYQFYDRRRQPVSVLCCSRLSYFSSSDHSKPSRQAQPNMSLSLSAARMSAVSMPMKVEFCENTRDKAVAASLNDDDDDGQTQLVTIPHAQFCTEDSCIETLV